MPPTETLAPALPVDEAPQHSLVQLGAQPKMKVPQTPEEVQDMRAAARTAIDQVKAKLDLAFTEAYADLSTVDHWLAARFRGTLGFVKGHVQTWEG